MSRNRPIGFLGLIWKQSRELIAWGGPAREKQAEAWGEGHGAGWNDCLLDLQNGGAKATPNPYRAASVRGEE